MRHLLLFDYQFQVAILLFQKLLAFGLYLISLDFLFYVLSLSYLEKYNTEGDVDSKNMSAIGLVVYLRFLVVHACSQ